MLPNPNPLKTSQQAESAKALVEVLADVLDLAGNAKLAHWHVRGPQFIALHKLFDDFADVCRGAGDRIAERVTLALGGEVLGTARQIAEESRLEDYPEKERRGEALCKWLVQAAKETSAGIQAARATCEKIGDVDSANMLQDVAATIEQGAGLIAAHLV